MNQKVENILNTELNLGSHPSGAAQQQMKAQAQAQAQAQSSLLTTFAIRNLSVLAYANGFTLWHYRNGNVSPNHCALPNFFLDAQDMLSVGDMILVSGAENGTIFVVHHNEGKTLLVIKML